MDKKVLYHVYREANNLPACNCFTDYFHRFVVQKKWTVHYGELLTCVNVVLFSYMKRTYIRFLQSQTFSMNCPPPPPPAPLICKACIWNSPKEGAEDIFDVTDWKAVLRDACLKHTICLTQWWNEIEGRIVRRLCFSGDTVKCKKNLYMGRKHSVTLAEFFFSYFLDNHKKYRRKKFCPSSGPVLILLKWHVFFRAVHIIC